MNKIEDDKELVKLLSTMTEKELLELLNPSKLKEEFKDHQVFSPFVCSICGNKQEDIITIQIGLSPSYRMYKYSTNVNVGLWKFNCGHLIDSLTLEENKEIEIKGI